MPYNHYPLIVSLVSSKIKDIFDEAQYTRENYGRITVNYKCFKEHNLAKLRKLLGWSIRVSSQSLITVNLDDKEYYLTGYFKEMPFVHGVFSNILLVQVSQQVYCLSINDNLAITNVMTLSNPVGRYRKSKITRNGRVIIKYLNADEIGSEEDDDCIKPEVEIFQLDNEYEDFCPSSRC